MSNAEDGPFCEVAEIGGGWPSDGTADDDGPSDDKTIDDVPQVDEPIPSGHAISLYCNIKVLKTV